MAPGNGEGQAPENGEDQAPWAKVRELAETVTAYLAIPVVLVYPFGFVALFVQFTRYFELDSYTAWYAVSLVNRTIVIGQGANILVVALIGSVLLSSVIGRILLWGAAVGRRVIWPVGLALVLVTALVLYVLYSRILAMGRVSWSAIVGREPGECRAEALRHQLNLWPDSLFPAFIFASGILLGGLMIYWSYRKYDQGSLAGGRRYPEGSNPLTDTFWFFIRGAMQRWIWPGLIVAYASSIAASLVLAALTPAFMPYINFGSTGKVTDEASSAAQLVEQTTAEGTRLRPLYAAEPEVQPTYDRLLSYADAHWHFIHRGEDPKGEREYRVLSLRDSEVSYARVLPEGSRTSRVAPFPWTENAVARVSEPCWAVHVDRAKPPQAPDTGADPGAPSPNASGSR